MSVCLSHSLHPFYGSFLQAVGSAIKKMFEFQQCADMHHAESDIKEMEGLVSC